jgi:hypothetical protein
MSSVLDTLFSSFEEHSIIWIIISGIIGAFLTATTKFFFEHTLPQWQLKRATRIAIQKYSFPVLRSAYVLETTVRDLLLGIYKKRLYESRDDYYRLRVLYLFGRFLGWCKILSNESVLEYVERSEIIKSKNVKKFTMYYDLIFQGIINLSYFSGIEDISSAEYESARIPALVVSCIGDLMIKESTKSKEIFSDIISFLEFTRYYQENPEFKKWFSYLENLLTGLESSQTNPKWNRLIIFYTNLCVFIDFLNRNNKKSTLTGFLLNVIRKFFHRDNLEYVITQNKAFQNMHPAVKNRMLKDLGILGYRLGYI